MLRTSERGTWRTCPQKWWWGYRLGLVPKGPPHFNFWFGIGVHEALAEWYQPGLKRGLHPAKSWQQYAKDEYVMMKSFEGDTKEYHDAYDLGTAMLEHYVDTYGKDRNWFVLATEQTRKVAVYDADGVHVGWYLYTMDGVYRDRDDHNKIKIMEHKTASIINLGHLSLDDQAGSYLTFETENLREEGVLGPDEQIDEVTYNFLRKAVKKVDERARNEYGQALNKDGTVSKQQGVQAPILVRHDVPRSAEYRARCVDRIVIEFELMQQMRDRPELIYKSPQAGPFGCGSCPFHEMCELHEEGADWEDYKEWKFVPKDPYGPYRKAS